MSLLPIIYTSLIIFSSVLFIVLVVSYISYKYKQTTKVALVGVSNRENYLKPIRSSSKSVGQSYNNLQPRKHQNLNTQQRQFDHINRYPKTKSQYYRDHKNIGDRKIDVIYRDQPAKNAVPPSTIRRMSIVEDLGRNAFPRREFNQTTEYDKSFEFSANTGRNVLRYYDDF